MSILKYPRIHFRGTFTVNPATADNDDVAVAIDRANVQLLPPIATMSTADALAWLTTGVPAISIINQQIFTYLRGGWNPFGDMTTEFVDVRVCSTTGSDGNLNTIDPLVGSWLAIDGTLGVNEPRSKPKLCDLDPCGTALTQLFLGLFRIGDSTLGLKATCDRKAFGRWVAFRNVLTYPGEQNFPGAGAVFQFTIPKDHLNFYQGKATGSPALAALEAAATNAQGIVVQFATFQVLPSLTDDVLIASLQDPNSTTSNPATGLVVGTVGVWEEGESATVPDGRLLLPPADGALLQQQIGPASPYLGPATAYVQRDTNVVSLNLIATFPENGYQSPLVKADFGRVRLGVIPKGASAPIAVSDPIDYDYRTYELVAGIIDVEYDTDIASRDMLDQGTLVLVAGPDQAGNPVPMLTESERVVTVMSVGQDDAGVYLDKDKTVDLSIVVSERGGPPSVDVDVYLWEFQYVTDPGGWLKRALSILCEVGAGIVHTHRLGFAPKVRFVAGKTDPLVIPVTGKCPGGAVIALTLDGSPPTGSYPWGTAFYTGFRVLPVDDYSRFPASATTSWDFMYEHVFRYYRLIFPAMSNVVPFDNQAAMESAADSLVQFTDPAISGSSRYMPVSRDLSTGKRDLIVAWRDSLRGAGRGFLGFFWP